MENVLEEIRNKILDLKEELKGLETPKCQFLIDNDDEYQSNLELIWRRKEIQEEIEYLENKFVIEK